MVVTYSLCALLMLAVCGTSSAQFITITITGGISPAATLGTLTSYSLTCTANSPNVTWTSYPAGTVGSLTTSGSTTSRPLTLPSPVVLSYAGLYVCTASANGVSTTASYAFNVTVTQVTIGNTVPQLYGTVGGSIAIICSASIGGTNDKPLVFQWIGPTGVVMSSSGRIYVKNVTTIQNQGFTFYTSTLTFSTLSSQDNNSMYQCSVGTMYTPYFTQYTPSSSMTTVVVSALTLSPTISGPSCQQAVLQLNCTAAKPLSVVPPVVFSWYRGSGGIFSPLGPGVPGTNVSMTPQGANVSTLTIAGSSVGGSYVYQCEASVAVPDDVPVVAYATTGVVNFSLFGMVSGLTLQSSGRLVWEAPVVNCNTVSYYTVTMTMYSDGTLVEMGTTTQQYYTLTMSYAPGVPYIATVGTMFVVSSSGAQNTSQQALVYSQELAPSGILNITVTSINGSTILLSWKPLSPVEARGFVRYYLVTWTPGTRGTRGTTGGGTANLTADTTTFLITGLDPMVTYMVSVSAGTIAGVGITTNSTAMPTGSAPTAVMTTSNILCGQLCIIIIVVVGGCVLLVLLVMVLIITVCACLHCRQKHRSVDLRMTDISQQQPDKKSASPDQLSSTDMDTMEPLNSYEMIKGGMAIPLSEFSAYVARNHMDRDKGFELEYQATSMEGTYPMESAALPCNKAKNRFHNISPYDHNRVCLSELDGEEGSDYINASYIDGYNQKRAYIVAQGPMPSTVRDFWRMVWQEQVNTIVMLTQCNEGGKRKCEQYWPDSVGGVNEPFPGLRVTLNDSMTFADYETRKMSITCNGSEPLEISHFQFLGWPDHGVPLYSTSLLGFIKRVRSEHRQDGSPLVVHCSAGVGRSGAFIILDYLMGSMSDAVNIQDCLAKLREQRASVVQTLAQYVFIHDALNELITCGDTQINASELAARTVKMREVDKNTNDTQSAFQDQFKLLEIVCHKPTSNDTSDARQDFNHDKNRYPDRVPYNRDRVRLKAIGVGVQGGEYINASFVDGYKARNAYIAAQAPLMNTVNDFWRMVWEFKSMTIVMLCGLDEQHGIAQFWPLRAGESYSLGKLSVSLESRSEDGYCYKLRLRDEKDSSQQLQVTLFCHPGWPEMECPEETKSVISIADSVVRAQMQCGNTNNKYITVVCNDGMGRTGAFITIHAMMERLKTEHVVDFFQFIKSSRVRRPNFVRSLEQYIYCHEVIADYVEMNVAYANFQDTSKPK